MRLRVMGSVVAALLVFAASPLAAQDSSGEFNHSWSDVSVMERLYMEMGGGLCSLMGYDAEFNLGMNFIVEGGFNAYELLFAKDLGLFFSVGARWEPLFGFLMGSGPSGDGTDGAIGFFAGSPLLLDVTTHFKLATIVLNAGVNFGTYPISGGIADMDAGEAGLDGTYPGMAVEFGVRLGDGMIYGLAWHFVSEGTAGMNADFITAGATVPLGGRKLQYAGID